uniref:Uncharacterized protein n=1 Tax=Anguilla anguilla TaxID=7936 RepID=A0A0E9QEM8_ANGAN
MRDVIGSQCKIFQDRGDVRPGGCAGQYSCGRVLNQLQFV